MEDNQSILSNLLWKLCSFVQTLRASAEDFSKKNPNPEFDMILLMLVGVSSVIQDLVSSWNTVNTEMSRQTRVLLEATEQLKFLTEENVRLKQQLLEVTGDRKNSKTNDDLISRLQEGEGLSSVVKFLACLAREGHCSKVLPVQEARLRHNLSLPHAKQVVDSWMLSTEETLMSPRIKRFWEANKINLWGLEIEEEYCSLAPLAEKWNREQEVVVD